MREDNLPAGQLKAMTGINQLWVADITYIRLHQEWVYLAVILDAFWELERNLTARLPMAALERAIVDRSRRPASCTIPIMEFSMRRGRA
jgi:transposase InsO family protein